MLLNVIYKLLTFSEGQVFLSFPREILEKAKMRAELGGKNSFVHAGD